MKRGSARNVRVEYLSFDEYGFVVERVTHGGKKRVESCGDEVVSRKLFSGTHGYRDGRVDKREHVSVVRVSGEKIDEFHGFSGQLGVAESVAYHRVQGESFHPRAGISFGACEIAEFGKSRRLRCAARQAVE